MGYAPLKVEKMQKKMDFSLITVLLLIMHNNIEMKKIECNKRNQHTKFEKNPIKIDKVMRVQSLQKISKNMKKCEKIAIFAWKLFCLSKLMITLRK